MRVSHDLLTLLKIFHTFSLTCTICYMQLYTFLTHIFSKFLFTYGQLVLLFLLDFAFYIIIYFHSSLHHCNFTSYNISHIFFLLYHMLYATIHLSHTHVLKVFISSWSVSELFLPGFAFYIINYFHSSLHHCKFLHPRTTVISGV